MNGLDIRPVLYVVGSLLIILALAMLVPMAADLYVGHADWSVFAVSFALTLFFGVSLLLTNATPNVVLSIRQAFLLTTLSWVMVGLFAALPFMFSEVNLSITDAYFESMSGLTTTGSTVITGLDALPPGMLLWRSLIQWMGGIGIIVMAIAILPFLRVGGMQLFRSESSDRSDKVVPRAADLAVGIGLIYLSLTVLGSVALHLAGMSAFDAICHAMTALATGGFSTRDASVGAWESASIEWVAVVLMLLGGMPFVRYLSFLKGHYDAIWRDTQVQWYLLFLTVVSATLGAWLALTSDLSPETALRSAAFNIVSVVTTTGYASTDYSAWGALAVAAFFVLTLIGGCTGSTSGGIKIFRFEILLMVLQRQFARLYRPHRILPLTYHDRTVDSDIMLSVMSFGFMFMALLLVFATALGALGLDLVTALSGSATALANVGPGLGTIIGPAGNFAPLPDTAKWVLIAAMLMGRLEFFTVLVLLSPDFWKR